MNIFGRLSDSLASLLVTPRKNSHEVNDGGEASSRPLDVTRIAPHSHWSNGTFISTKTGDKRKASPNDQHAAQRTKLARLVDGPDGAWTSFNTPASAPVKAEQDDDDIQVGMSHIPSSSPTLLKTTPALTADSGSSDSGFAEESPDNFGVDDTLVISEEEYTLNTLGARTRQQISLPDEHAARGVSTEELRAAGWDDEYITLMQKITMRGFEPLLPRYLKFDFRFLPDELFEDDDNAFIGSVQGNHFRASRALEKLLELGSRVRDRIYLEGAITPEEQVRRQLLAYIKWATEDARLDKTTLIPILTLEIQPASHAASNLRDRATAQCAAIADRYRVQLSIQRSVEISPPQSPLHQPPLPTIYAIVASHAMVALMAYRPAPDPFHTETADEPTCVPMAYFDFRNKDYDVWNALALAVTVCHVRNVHMRIAQETGIGMATLHHSGLLDNHGLSIFDDPDA